MPEKEKRNRVNLPMIGASHVVSYVVIERCHGSKIGFAFGLFILEKHGLSGWFNCN